MRDVKKDEALWKAKDWICPRCDFVNKAIRPRCRNFECGFPRPESVVKDAIKEQRNENSHSAG